VDVHMNVHMNVHIYILARTIQNKNSK